MFIHKLCVLGCVFSILIGLLRKEWKVLYLKVRFILNREKAAVPMDIP